MQYAFVFALLGSACGFVGLTAVEPTGGCSLVFIHPAVSFLLLALAYAGTGSAILGKRADGGRVWWARVVFAPYLLLTRFSFGLYKLFGRHAPWCEVVPNLFLGRRLTVTEANRFDTAAVLDLAAEFSETRSLRSPDHYLSVPVLDATPPTVEQLTTAVRWIADQLAHRPVFVHCALGHGRSASVVIAYLLHAGQVTTIRDGLRRVRGLRPGVGLSASQRRGLEGWWATRNPTPAT